MQEEVPFNIGIWYNEVMINEVHSKCYCSEDLSLIENYHTAIADKERKWEIHHRRECDENGKILFTREQLIEMNLYYKRPASELIFVTRSTHCKIHRELHEKCGKTWGKKGGKKTGAINGKKSAIKQSIPILQLTKDGEFIKEWQSAMEAQRQLGIGHSSICRCCKGRLKSAGGFVWRYKDSK